MVLERLISIREAIKNPWWMFIVGGLISVLSLLVAFLVPIFPNDIGLFSSILITFAMTPFMVNLFSYEEAKEEEEWEKRRKMNLFLRYREILAVYAAFFIGVVLTKSIIFLILPESFVEKIFEDQLTTIKLIRGSLIFFDTFQRIVINNLGVLILSFLFSFLYGSGAIFILSWNASVLATAVGLTAKSLGGFKGLPTALLVYFPHGSLEILAYFLAGIAGGVISVAISRRKSKFFRQILIDSFILLGIASFIIIIAGIVEVFAFVIA
ncbi:MAG: stage II sporulation protein M [Candidatus Aenigmatarchaeota archaeon]